MEILNTIEPHVSGGAIVFGLLTVGLALLFAFVFIVGMYENELGPALAYFALALLFAIGASKILTTPDVPERYEVVIREGNVIDARQYDIIEQRGQIYVIQAREQSE